ncbi:MAG: methionine--tRNA ligase [Rhodospirillaceae bacterium]
MTTRSNDTYYVTTPIYYVNGNPHVGHAYTTIACDVLARFKRLDGFQVKFLTGTDEHGQKVAKVAAEKDLTPQAFTDKISQVFKELTTFLEVTNDDFIRTTEERHIKACQALWSRITSRNAPDGKPWIELGKYAGWYAVSDEAYYAEDEITDGPDGKVGPSGATVEWVEEESYFFRLSAAQRLLLDYYDEHPDFIAPKSRLNEVTSFVTGGLKDLSISRTGFDWGIPVPGDSKHVMYVWMDALTNYITATGFPDEETAGYKDFWPADLHMIGKDIIRFHCVYWPAFLLAADLELPRRIFAHGWWTVKDAKMSKSLGNVIDPYSLVETYGLDQVRYFLLREITFGADGDFSIEGLINRANGELANDFGNLAQRVLSMIHKNCNACVPEPNQLLADDNDILNAAASVLEPVRDALDRQGFNEAIEAIWVVVRAANAYVDKQAPWKLRKEDPERMATVLYVLTDVIRMLTLVMQVFTPNGAEAILDQLSIPDEQRDFRAFRPGNAPIPGEELPKPEPVFKRLESPEE